MPSRKRARKSRRSAVIELGFADQSLVHRVDERRKRLTLPKAALEIGAGFDGRRRRRGPCRARSDAR